jgi:hypothetical protein
MQPFRLIGAEWFKRKKDESDLLGPKDRMKVAAARLGHKALLHAERRGGKRFYNVFGSYPDRETAAAALELVSPGDRHAYELLIAGASLKPFVDVDCDELPSRFADVAAIAARMRGLTDVVMKKNFGVLVAEAEISIIHTRPAVALPLRGGHPGAGCSGCRALPGPRRRPQSVHQGPRDAALRRDQKRQAGKRAQGPRRGRIQGRARGDPTGRRCDLA